MVISSDDNNSKNHEETSSSSVRTTLQERPDDEGGTAPFIRRHCSLFVLIVLLLLCFLVPSRQGWWSGSSTSRSLELKQNKSAAVSRQNKSAVVVALIPKRQGPPKSKTKNVLSDKTVAESTIRQQEAKSSFSGALAETVQNRVKPTQSSSSLTYQCPIAESSLPEMKFVNDAFFLHLGKGGGGTIRELAINGQWRLGTRQCHPQPCQAKLRRAWRQPQRRAAFLINIRDPIDRFVSIFYWALTIYCDPERDDSRIPVRKNIAYRVRSHCLGHTKDIWHRGFEAFYYRYNSDINQLVEGLCSSDEEQSAKAKKAIWWNKHARNKMTTWFSFMKQPMYNRQSVYPLVLDKSVANLYDQTDAAMVWLHNYTAFENATQFTQRQEMARHYSYCRQHNVTLTHGSRDAVHTSSIGRVRKIPLTPANEQCLAWFFRNDYALMPRIQNELCKSDDCRRGLQSMLDRRKPLLDKIVDKSEA